MPIINIPTYLIIVFFFLTITICAIYNHKKNKNDVLKVDEISLTLRKKIKSPLQHYVISNDLYNKLSSDIKNEKYLNLLVQDILNHLKLPNNHIKINLVDSIHNKYTQNAIGQYGAFIYLCNASFCLHCTPKKYIPVDCLPSTKTFFLTFSNYSIPANYHVADSILLNSVKC